MSAQDLQGGIYNEEGERITGRSRSSEASVFSKVTDRVSNTLEQIAGTIHEKTRGMRREGQESKLADVGERAAGALHSSANYLKQADLDQIQTDLRSTIKRNPERSVLVGLGVGLLLGAILRKKG